ANNFCSLLLLQVRSDTALAAVHRKEIMRDVGIANLCSTNKTCKHPTADVAAGAILDLGDFSAEIGEKKSCQGTLNFLRDLDNFDSSQWLRHVPPSGHNVTGREPRFRTAERRLLLLPESSCKPPWRSWR